MGPFHVRIAVPLEEYGKAHIHQTFYTADEIEAGEFVAAMLEILSIQYQDLSEVEDFVESVRLYDGLPAREIPQETAHDLFQRFRRLLKKGENEL